jgi:cysteine desulfuration protein SufE
MENSCLDKQKQIMTLFQTCASQEERYQKIIDLGRLLPKLNFVYKTTENIVKGCQSTLYLLTYEKDHLMFFEAESDALISAGLAAILIYVYNGESAETLLTCPPTYLETLGIAASLTPNRANGLYSIHLRMKQEALKILTRKH